MNFEIALIGLAIYLLIWEKLPEWGEWFNKMINALPKIIQSLYEGWRCPYCSGFWISLALYELTGIQTIESLPISEQFVFSSEQLMFRFLDALATATIILFLKLLLDAISGFALKGYLAKKEFKSKMNKS